MGSVDGALGCCWRATMIARGGVCLNYPLFLSLVPWSLRSALGIEASHGHATACGLLKALTAMRPRVI